MKRQQPKMHSGATKVIAVLDASNVLRCKPSYNRYLKMNQREAVVSRNSQNENLVDFKNFSTELFQFASFFFTWPFRLLHPITHVAPRAKIRQQFYEASHWNPTHGCLVLPLVTVFSSSMWMLCSPIKSSWKSIQKTVGTAVQNLLEKRPENWS